MAHNSLLHGYSWDSQYEDTSQQFPRPIQDEVISVYEVYVKEETVGADGRSEVSVISGVPGAGEELIQGDCMDLDAAIESEVINVDGSVTKLLSKDAMKYKILEQNMSADQSMVMYSHPVNEGPSTTTTRLIDKDDPRSRLHFVKYLKRDGKTLKIWECGICSKEFRHQYTLMRHLPTHTDERNFKCEACGKAFRQLSTLSQHRAIHSDARPYVCEFCKKTFNRVSTLISHRKTHSEHKPHKCHLCGKGFHQKGNLRNHVFTHTNERPYKCELCGKGFNQMSNLVCHKVKAHAHAEKMQYVCGICGKEFPRRFSLRSHEEYKHGMKYHNPAALQDINDMSVMRNKNVRIVHLPNGDRTIICDGKQDLNTGGEYTESVVVDKIETKAMESAILQGQTPFALFKPAKGIPVLVKISPTSNRKQMLTPATAEDLRMAGKMTLSPTLSGDADGVKAVQIKVPVVATVTQTIDPDGKFNFLIEPPGPDHEQESLIEPIDTQFSCPEQVCSDLSRLHQQPQSSTSEDCSELLELAAQGGIQFVRATEDGRYEVMTNSEARDLMAQNSHDVTILDEDDADTINVVNVRNDGNPDEVIIGDADTRITVLDTDTSRKNITMDGIEILDAKDIRIMGDKEFDDRYVQGITFLDQPKMNDLILGPKTLNIAVSGHENAITSQHDLSVLTATFSRNRQTDVTTSSQAIQSPIASLLNKNQPGISILNENLQNLKPGQSLTERITVSGNGAAIESQDTDYISKMKLTGYEDSGVAPELISLPPQEVKILGAKPHNVKILGQADTVKEKDPQLGTFNEMRILGPKNQAPEVVTRYKEVKILGNYDQFLKCNLTGDVQVNATANQKDNARTEVKILGKKTETCVTSVSDENNDVVILGDANEPVSISIPRAFHEVDQTYPWF